MWKFISHLELRHRRARSLRDGWMDLLPEWLLLLFVGWGVAITRFSDNFMITSFHRYGFGRAFPPMWKKGCGRGRRFRSRKLEANITYWVNFREGECEVRATATIERDGTIRMLMVLARAVATAAANVVCCMEWR